MVICGPGAPKPGVNHWAVEGKHCRSAAYYCSGISRYSALIAVSKYVQFVLMPDTMHKHWNADKLKVWPMSCVWFAWPSVYWALIAPCCHVVTICCPSGKYGQNCHRGVHKGTTKIWFVRKNRRWVSKLQFTWGTDWFCFKDVLSVLCQFVPVSRVWCSSMAKAPPAETVLGVFKRRIILLPLMQSIPGKHIMRSRYHFSKGIMRTYIHMLDACIRVHVYTTQEHICIKLQSVSALHCSLLSCSICASKPLAIAKKLCPVFLPHLAILPNGTSQITLLIIVPGKVQHYTALVPVLNQLTWH